MQTLQSALAAQNERPTGFGFVRIALASGVIIWHSFPLSFGALSVEGGFALFVDVLVPMFLVISGFLVTGSAQRAVDLRTFVSYRILRIGPALATEVTISALLLGPVVTDLALAAYFTDTKFFFYLTNIFGFVRYELPGVFLQNPYPNVVNGSLWTVPVEIQCYVVMSAIVAVGIFRRPRMLAVALAFLFALTVVPLFVAENGGIQYLLARFLSLLAYFIAGSALYLYREWVPRHALLFAAAVAVSVICLTLGLPRGVLPIALAYVTVYLGTLSLPPLKADYSYGMYLYSFPIQQFVAFIFPWSREWWLNFSISFPIILLCAIASWYLIERPALELKKRISLGLIGAASHRQGPT